MVKCIGSATNDSRVITNRATDARIVPQRFSRRVLRVIKSRPDTKRSQGHLNTPFEKRENKLRLRSANRLLGLLQLLHIGLQVSDVDARFEVAVA